MVRLKCLYSLINVLYSLMIRLKCPYSLIDLNVLYSLMIRLTRVLYSLMIRLKCSYSLINVLHSQMVRLKCLYSLIDVLYSPMIRLKCLYSLLDFSVLYSPLQCSLFTNTRQKNSSFFFLSLFFNPHFLQVRSQGIRVERQIHILDLNILTQSDLRVMEEEGGWCGVE